jgi:acyl-coenzyme A thioesterase PaaI-like protein
MYMLMLINILGKDYVVWDKSANIKFVRPGKSTLYAQFLLTPEYITTMKSEVNAAGEMDYQLDVELKDAEGQVIAVAQRTLYVATKAHYKQKQGKKKEKHG